MDLKPSRIIVIIPRIKCPSTQSSTPQISTSTKFLSEISVSARPMVPRVFQSSTMDRTSKCESLNFNIQWASQSKKLRTEPTTQCLPVFVDATPTLRSVLQRMQVKLDKCITSSKTLKRRSSKQPLRNQSHGLVVLERRMSSETA